jgi:hypothetical protein
MLPKYNEGDYQRHRKFHLNSSTSAYNLSEMLGVVTQRHPFLIYFYHLIRFTLFDHRKFTEGRAEEDEMNDIYKSVKSG